MPGSGGQSHASEPNEEKAAPVGSGVILSGPGVDKLDKLRVEQKRLYHNQTDPIFI